VATVITDNNHGLMIEIDPHKSKVRVTYAGKTLEMPVSAANKCVSLLAYCISYEQDEIRKQFASQAVAESMTPQERIT
jgi:hypothetical protein